MRHPSLIPLSHDHHHGLALALRCRKQALGQLKPMGAAGLRERATEFLAFYRSNLAAHFRAGQREDWLRRLTEMDVPAAPINTLDEVFADPQVKTYGFPVEVEHPRMGKMKLLGNAVGMSRTPPTIDRPPPMLGEHTEEVLTALGYAGEKIVALREQGVV